MTKSDFSLLHAKFVISTFIESNFCGCFLWLLPFWISFLLEMVFILEDYFVAYAFHFFDFFNYLSQNMCWIARMCFCIIFCLFHFFFFCFFIGNCWPKCFSDRQNLIFNDFFGLFFKCYAFLYICFFMFPNNSWLNCCSNRL